MAVDGGTQVVHHPLADGVREQRLRDAERPGGDRDRDHPGDQRREQLGVVLGDRLVEHGSQQERRDHAERRGDQNQARSTDASRRR